MNMQDVTLLIKPASSLCNMRCDYCFYTDVSSQRELRSYGIMNSECLELLIRRAFEIAKRSVTFVFQGGEPMLAGIEFFEKVIAYQKKYNSLSILVYNTIQTNATLIDEAFAAFFKAHRFLVGVSLDGNKALHDLHRRFPDSKGSYDRVLEGIKLLQKYNVDFNVLAVISKDSAKAPAEVYSALKKYGYLQFIPLIDDFDGEKTSFSLSAEDYGRFLSEVFELYYRDLMRGSYVSIRDFDSYVNMLRGLPPSSCAMQGRCGGYFTVESDGSVYPCDFYVTDEYRMGNIRNDSFITIAESEKFKDFIKSSVCIDEKCRSCKWYKLCRGGCRRHREPFPTITRFCKAYSFFFEKSYSKMQKIAALINAASYRQKENK